MVTINITYFTRIFLLNLNLLKGRKQNRHISQFSNGLVYKENSRTASAVIQRNSLKYKREGEGEGGRENVDSFGVKDQVESWFEEVIGKGRQ